MSAIVFLLILHVFSIKYVKRRAMKFANYELMERFTGEKILSKNYVTLVFRMVTLVFLVLAISGMVIMYSGRSSESDFVLAIDSSGSMLAVDYEPNRMTAAKDAAHLFLDSLPEKSGVGVISFAGISFVRQALSDDLDKAKEAVDSINVEPVGGTAIGDAMISSANLLANSDRPKVIVLLTDGQSNVGTTLQEALVYVKESGILINTIGIGTEEGGMLQNTTFVSKLDTTSLEMIANQTGGDVLQG
jgi:Ca-activated chloride channel family protein